MAQKKGFFGRFFRHDDADETGLSESVKRDIRDTLTEDYGLTIENGDISVDPLTDKRYRRLHAEEVVHLSQVFQYIPQLIANGVQSKAVQKAFTAATEGTYRLSLAPGMHLCRSRLSEGAFRGIGLSDSTNQVAGSAEWFKNNATLAVSKAPQIALGIFNAVSMATGQYFMSQINAKLASLSDRMGRLESILHAERRGKLNAAAEELREVMARVEFDIHDVHKVNADIGQIHDIQRVTREDIHFCREMIETEKQHMDANDKVEQIKTRIDVLRGLLAEYQYATQLYGIAALLEVQIRGITDPQELERYREQIDHRVSVFKQDYSVCETTVNRYLSDTHALNDPGILQWLTIGASGAIAALLPGSQTNGLKLPSHIAGFVGGLFDDRRRKKKETIMLQAQDCFEMLRDMRNLESPASAIENYIQAVGCEVEFIRIGEVYYTNLPEVLDV